MKKCSRIINNSLIIIAGIALFLVIILGSFSIMIFYEGFYFDEYAKNHVYDKLSANRTEAINQATAITNNIFDFFHYKSQLGYFTSDEKSHMEDVRSLIMTMRYIYYTSALAFVAIFLALYFRFRKEAKEAVHFHFIRLLSRILLIGSITALAFILMLFLMSVFYFSLTFLIFHQLFFPGGNWMFDTSSLLITLFPEQFFFDITLRIFVYAILQGVVFLLIGWWLRKNVRLHERFHR